MRKTWITFNTMRVFDIPDNTDTVETVANRKATLIVGKIRREFHDKNHPRISEARAAHAASWLADGVTFHGYNHYYSDVCIDALRAGADQEVGHVLMAFDYSNKTLGKRTFYRIGVEVFSTSISSAESRWRRRG
jgi:hypothetical protein